jgi:drug/metabolite transporter (DMT)-like permease
LKIPLYVFLIFATLFWAGNLTFGRVLWEALPPFSIDLVRWSIACVLLVPLALAREGRSTPPKESFSQGPSYDAVV